MEVAGTNRALVIGAQGVLGALMVRAFEAAGWVVRSGARRPTPGQVEIDVGRPDSIAAAVDEHELVVNTVPHPDLLAERYVLEHGGALINVSDLPASSARSLRAVAGGARGTVVMNAGLAPGVTTIVAADLLRLHPAASELEIVFTLSLSVSRGPASADFIHRGLTAVTRHRTAVVRLPSPFGERRCLGFGEGDAGWLGGIAEGRIVRQYVCIAEPGMHERLLRLNNAGAIASMPRSLIESRKQNGERTTRNEAVAHWVAAIRDWTAVRRPHRRMPGRLAVRRPKHGRVRRLIAHRAAGVRLLQPGGDLDAQRPRSQAASRRNLSRVTSAAVNRAPGRGQTGATSRGSRRRPRRATRWPPAAGGCGRRRR